MTESGDRADAPSNPAEGSGFGDSVPDDSSRDTGGASAGSEISQGDSPDGRTDRSDPRKAGQPTPGEVHPWLDESDVDEPAEEDEPPFIVRVIGQIGVYLAMGSLGLAVFGVAGIYIGFQPWGNVATTLALVGVTVAMFMGMVFQVYIGEYRIGR